MAHECEECGAMCYCDGEDTFFDEMPADCRHWERHGFLEDLIADEYEEDQI